MNINLELYRVFYIVAINKNITKASEELNISQPAISKSIKNLEEQLGGQLFIRTKKGVILTTEGEEFFKHIKNAMECIHSAENKFNEMISLEIGSIKIGSSITLTKEFLLPYLDNFHKLYPKIKIEIITNRTEELISKLKNGLIDLVILNTSTNIDDELETIKCKKLHDCFVVGKKYKELANNPIELKDLNNYPLILQSKGSKTRFSIDEYAKNNNVLLESTMELSSYNLVVEFAKLGFGIGYATTEYIEDDIKNKNLFTLQVIPKLPTKYIGLTYLKNQTPNFSTKRFIEEIIKENQ